VERSPLFLAALASAAVPGLDPASVEGVPSGPGQRYDVAFVEDTMQHRWVVRAPRTAAAGAQMDQTVALLGLLARRLPFSVPMPRGFVALNSGARAAVYPYLPGQPLDFSALPPGGGISADLGRSLAALHNADRRLFDEAGLPTYDADTWRTRRLSDIDRAAETQRVPAPLLARWERALEDVTLWRYAPTPVHGDLTGDHVLVAVEDDGSSGRVMALTGWEDAKVADPAEDFAGLVVQAPPEALDTVMEAYAHARAEGPDPNLLVRARLAAELKRMTDLLAALPGEDAGLVEALSTELEELNRQVVAEAAAADDDHSMSLAPRTPRAVVAPPAHLEDEEDEDVPGRDDPVGSAPERLDQREPELAELAEPELSEPKLAEAELSEPKLAEPQLSEPKLAGAEVDETPSDVMPEPADLPAEPEATDQPARTGGDVPPPSTPAPPIEFEFDQPDDPRPIR
jgi:macrolide phosphotransferase